MRKIKDIVPKPSDAMEAMMRGAIKQSERPDFVIDMMTFGCIQGDICYGCMATCTIQEVAGENLSPGDIVDQEYRAEALQFDFYDLCQFEDAIDKFRQGMPSYLFEYYDIPFSSIDYSEFTHFDLQNGNWREQLPKVQEFIDQIKAMGY